MGVRGLTTYINYNQEAFLKTYFLHDSCIVIDGHSLCAQLYRALNCFSAFGGDYDKFASYTRNFFKNLRKCNIAPYVIFDGSYEQRKLKTAYNRLRSKINGASRLDPVTQGSLQIFPLLLRDVFKEVLSDAKIPYTVCEFEADDEIASMARHLNCPVLSYDSDFFIYNVVYIPFNTLEFKPKHIYVNGNRVSVLECKIYRVEYLTSHFGCLKQEMLPLLGTLLGNDYVEKRVFRKFFSQLKLAKSKKKKNEQQRCIHGLFKWLQNETLDTAITKILGRLKKSQKDRVFAIMKKSIHGYNSKQCRSLIYFNICNEITIPETNIVLTDHVIDEDLTADDIETRVSCLDDDVDSTSNAECSSGGEDSNTEDDQLILGLPEWFSEGIRQNHIPQTYINLYTHHLHFCSPQAEDYKDNDAFLCSLSILRYAFDILTDFSQDYCIYVSRENDCNYHRILVDKEYSLQRPLNIPFQELTDDQLKYYFNNFVKEKLSLFDVSVIELLPSNFQLYMIALLWWVAKCEVLLSHIHSLLICYVMLDVIDEKTGTFRGHHHFTNKYSKKIEDLKSTFNSRLEISMGDELYLIKNKVQYEDCLIAANVLLKHFELDDKIKKKPKSYDVRKMHSFAQFQCCLQQFNCLNILCRCPFESTKYSKCYNGTFVYNIAVRLENQISPYIFFEQYLKGATTVLMFYKSLCKVYETCEEKMSLKTSSWIGKKRRRRKNAKIDEEINFIAKGFESEVVI